MISGTTNSDGGTALTTTTSAGTEEVLLLGPIPRITDFRVVWFWPTIPVDNGKEPTGYVVSLLTPSTYVPLIR